MDIQQLRYFIKTYQTRSYSRAAEMLYTSRQALRHVIKTLEGEVGAPLFIPQGRLLSPTPAAEQLYYASLDVQQAFAKLEGALSAISVKNERKLRCGMVAGIHDAYTREEFAVRHSMRTAEHCLYVTASCKVLREMLRRGELDVAYLFADKAASQEFDSRYDRFGRLYLMVNINSPLARRDSVSIRDLRGLPFVSQGEEYDLHNLIAESCRKAGFQLNLVYTSSATFDIAAQVNSNFGASYSLTPKLLQYDFPNVICLPFEEDYMRWYLLHLICKDRKIGDIADTYWDTCKVFPEPR